MLGQEELQEIATNVKMARQNAKEGNYVSALTYYEVTLNGLARSGNRISDPEQGEIVRTIRDTIHAELDAVKRIENVLSVFKTKPKPRKSLLEGSDEGEDNTQDGTYDGYADAAARIPRRASVPRSADGRGDFARYKPPAPRPMPRNTPPISSNNNNNNMLYGAGGIGNRMRGMMGAGDGGRKPASPISGGIDSRRDYDKPWVNPTNPTPVGGGERRVKNPQGRTPVPSGVSRPGGRPERRGKPSDANEVPVIKGCSQEDVARIWNNILESRSSLTLDDLAGIDSVKEILNFTFIMPTLHPNLFKQIKGIKTILLFGPPGTGKCLGPDVLVKVRDPRTSGESPRRADEVEVGDILVGDDQGDRIVVSTTRGSSEMFKVGDKEGGCSYTCNGEHLLVLWFSDTISRLVDLKHIKESCEIKLDEFVEGDLCGCCDVGCVDLNGSNVLTVKASSLYSMLAKHPELGSHVRGLRVTQGKEKHQSVTTYSLCIESIGTGQYYGFTLASRDSEIRDENKSYMCLSSEYGLPNPEGVFPGRFQLWDGTVTHNTTIAKAISNVCQMRFLNITSSTLTSKFHGGSENLAKTLFAVAGYLGRCVIFFDEIDGVLTARGGANENEASLRVKTEILQCMQGIDSVENQDIFIIGATNCPWAIDPAALRRFDKKILIPLPDRAGRMDLFKHFTAKMNTEPDVRSDAVLAEFADKTEGWSGADIKQACDDSIRDAMMEFIKSKTPQEIAEAERSGMTINVAKRHMEASIGKHAPTASDEMVKRNGEWNRANGSSLE